MSQPSWAELSKMDATALRNLNSALATNNERAWLEASG